YVSSQYLQFVDLNGKPLSSKKFTAQAANHVTVYVRNDISSNTIGTLAPGESIDVYEEVGGWYLVKVNNRPGYIEVSQMVEKLPQEEKEEVAVTDIIGRTTANSVRVRSAASTNSDIVGELN